MDNFMRHIVGHRTARPIMFHASAEALLEGAKFNEEIYRLSPDSNTYVPKGVYRFRTHEEANRHQQECIAAGMAQLARERE